MPIPRIPNGPPPPPGPPRPSMRVWSTAVVDWLPAAVAAPVLMVDEPLDVFVAVLPSWRPMPLRLSTRPRTLPRTGGEVVGGVVWLYELDATLVELLPALEFPPVLAAPVPELLTPDDCDCWPYAGTAKDPATAALTNRVSPARLLAKARIVVLAPRPFCGG